MSSRTVLNVYLLAEDEQLYIQYNTDWSIVNEFIIMTRMQIMQL